MIKFFYVVHIPIATVVWYSNFNKYKFELVCTSHTVKLCTNIVMWFLDSCMLFNIYEFIAHIPLADNYCVLQRLIGSLTTDFLTRIKHD